MPPPVAVGGTPSQSWRLVFGAGAALWVASTIVLVLTDDDVLLPTVVLVGSFLVPVTVVQRESVASWTLPAPSTLSDPWLFSLVEWAVMISVAIAGSLLIHRRWRSAHVTQSG